VAEQTLNIVVQEKPPMQPASYLDDLNPAQRSAAEFDAGAVGTRPLLIIAGAGSGKTNTLAHRVAHLILSSADPQRILMLTFTRRAAAETTRRAERICARSISAATGQGASDRGLIPWSGTFHAIGNRLLRQRADAIGLHPDFTVLDRSDAADLMDLVRDDLKLSRQEKRFPQKSTCLGISFVINTQLSIADALERAYPWCAEWEAELRQLFRGYADAKQKQNVLDYDDLLLFWWQMMAEPAIAEVVRAGFDHVLVDESQDTNALQEAIRLGLKPDGAGLAVVGDDSQSVYSFRGATVRNILDFPEALRSAGDGDHTRAELSLDPARPRSQQCRHRHGEGALHQGSVLDPPIAAEDRGAHHKKSNGGIFYMAESQRG
jgi:DNA helicase-2/ATP-dependent DNA helicase PcrA